MTNERFLGGRGGRRAYRVWRFYREIIEGEKQVGRGKRLL